MNVLASLYGAGVRARNHLYDRGTLPARRLAGPVISIGNLTVGGAGKTPFVIMLGEMLKTRGIAFDVLSRGYGRRTRGVAMVDPEGSAADFGDEPLLIAMRLGAPVVVGEDRYGAGQAAEKKLGARLHLLDDGFQHRALARDLDIVLVSHSDVHDQLLPAGRLRGRWRRCAGPTWWCSRVKPGPRIFPSLTNKFGACAAAWSPRPARAIRSFSRHCAPAGLRGSIARPWHPACR